MVDGVNPAGIWSPFGAFSMAVIQGDGQVVHLKGQVSLDRQGQIVGAGDMRAQVRKVLANIQDTLASMGGLMGDVVSLIGVHHWVSPKHLNRYVQEMTFRYNRRAATVTDRMNGLFDQVEGRLTYAMLIA